MVRSGTVLDAAVSAELLKNIFFVKAPMHDGAVIVRHGRVLGAGCMLPLSLSLIHISRSVFESINAKRELEGKPLMANPRNGRCGGFPSRPRPPGRLPV